MQTLASVVQKSSQTITLALEKFRQQVEHEIGVYNDGLNKIMKIFTVISILFLPQTIIGGLWGMNVSVPFQDAETIYPFCGIVGTSIFFSFLALGYFRKVGYI